MLASTPAPSLSQSPLPLPSFSMGEMHGTHANDQGERGKAVCSKDDLNLIEMHCALTQDYFWLRAPWDVPCALHLHGMGLFFAIGIILRK
jgi:hypothetical protein